MAVRGQGSNRGVRYRPYQILLVSSCWKESISTGDFCTKGASLHEPMDPVASNYDDD